MLSLVASAAQLLTAFRPAHASPSANRLLNYQLRLTDAAGVPVADGTKNIKISFYDLASGGTRLHTDCGTTGTPVGRKVIFTNGVGTVLIGDTGAGGTTNCTDASAPNAIPATFFNNDLIFLGITIEADAEMTPRKRIVATGYSLNADRLDDLETSSTGGTNAFVPVTDASGNLTLSANVTVDTNTFFVDAANNRVGIGTTGPTVPLQLNTTVLGEITRLESSASAAWIQIYEAGTTRGYLGYGESGNLFTNATSDSIALRSDAALYLGSGTGADLSITAGGNVGVGDATPVSLFTVGDGDRFNVNTFGDVTSTFTTLDGSNTTNGTGSNSTSLTLNSATNFNVGNYIQLASTACVTNPCFAKITAIVTNTLTISPALSWNNADTVTEVHVPEIGGLDLTQALANRYGRGYFIDGIVTGNSSTTFTDNLIDTTANTLNFNTTNNRPVTFGTGTVTMNGNLSVTGTISSGGNAAFVNGGNSFGGAATLGTNDANSLSFETNNVTYFTIASGGGFTLPVDTNWTLTGGVNGLSFDGTTFSVDATNDRVGIGTASPGTNAKLAVLNGGVTVGVVASTADAALHITSSFGGFDRLTQMNPTGNSKPGLNLMASTDGSGVPEYWSWGVNSNAFRINDGTVFAANEGLTVTTAGDVGVNTSAPAQLLEVRKDQNAVTAARVANHNVDDTGNTTAHAQVQVFDGTNEANLVMWPEAHSSALLADSGGVSTNRPGGFAYEIFGGSAGDWKWVSAATERMRLSNGGNLTVTGDVAVNGGDLTTTASTFNLVNATATTVNIAGGATTLALAGGSGSTGCTIDGSGNLACTGSISGTGDTLDYDDFEDTMDLDAALVLNQGTNTWTQNYTGTGAGFTYNGNSVTGNNAFTINANALTDGSALQISSTTGAQTGGGAIFDINQAGTFVATTTVGGNTMAIRRQPSLSGASTTLTIDQALLDIIDVASVSGGATLAHSGSVARFIQNSSGATGDVVLISSSGSGDALQINQNASAADAINISATSLTTGQALKINAGNFTDDSGRALYIDTTEATATADILLIETDFSAANNQVFKVEADGEAFSDVGFTAGAFSTKFYDGSIDSTGTLSINATNNQAITTGTGAITFGGDVSIAAGKKLILSDSSNATVETGFLSTPFGGVGRYENYLLRSQEIDNAAWTKTGTTVSANASAGPDGTTTADRLNGTVTDTDNVSQAASGAPATASTTWTASLWMKSVAGPGPIDLRIDSGNETGTVKQITLTSGWQRATITQSFTSGSTGTATFRIINGVDSVDVWGVQLEKQSTVGVYAKTTSTAITTTGRGLVAESDGPHLFLSGNVGIGTTAPAGLLEIVSTTAGYTSPHPLRVTNTGATVGPYLFLDAENKDWLIAGSSSGNASGDQKFIVRDFSAATDRFLIDSVGAVTMTSGASTTNALTVTANSVTTGTGLSLPLNAITSGTGIDVSSTSNAMTTAKLLNASINPSNMPTDLSVDLASLSYNATYDTASTVKEVLGQGLDIVRRITNGSSCTSCSITISGALASIIENAGSVLAGSQTHSADVLRLQQNVTSNTGSVLNVTTAGTGFAFRVNDDGTFTDTTPFVVADDGDVGIGTTSPISGTRMHLSSAVNSTVAKFIIENTDTNLSADASMRFKTDTNDFAIGIDSDDDSFNIADSTIVGSSNRLKIFTSGEVTIPNTSFGILTTTGTPTEELDVEGQIQFDLDGGAGDTTIGVCKTVADAAGVEDDVEFVDCTSTPGDVAEWYETTGAEVAGDIVVMDGSTFTYDEGLFDPATGLPTGQTQAYAISRAARSSASYATRVLGVISTSPNPTIGEAVKDAGTHPKPVALSGRVPTRVNAQNGSIAVGDPIATSSVAGAGMKATKAGTVVGYALQAWNGPGEGVIQVFVKVGYYAGMVLGTDGAASLVMDDLTVAEESVASASATASTSRSVSFRGSAWDSLASQAVARSVTLTNVVTDKDAYRLSLTNETGGELAYFGSNGDVAIKGKLYPSDRGELQTNRYIYYDGSGGIAGNMMRTNASGWATGSFDFAEMFASDDELRAGELVMIDTRSSTKMRRAVGGREEAPRYLLAGIVSTEPGFLAGMNEAGHYPVALEGRVPTWVVGPVKIGEPITVSLTDGVGVVAEGSTYVVGYALDAKEGTAAGKVTVFVKPGWWNGKEVVQAENEISQTPPSALLGFMTSDLDMAGYAITTIGALSGINELWSIDGDGNFKTRGSLASVIPTDTGPVTAYATQSPDVEFVISGSGRLDTGAARIEFDQDVRNIISGGTPLKVTVSLTSPEARGVYVAEKSVQGFVVRELGGGTSSATFDWIVIARRKGFDDPVPAAEPQAPAPQVTEDPDAPPTEPAPEPATTASVQPAEPTTEPAAAETPQPAAEAAPSAQTDPADPQAAEPTPDPEGVDNGS